MSRALHLTRVRNELEPRREPYWAAPLGNGRYVGFRKLSDGTGSWIARFRDDEGKQLYRALGQATKEFGFNAAKQAAEAWFRNRSAGVDDRPATVADACREYVAELEAEGRGAIAKGDRRRDPAAVPGWGAAHDAEMRFRRHVYDDPIGRIRLDKLRAQRLKEWRNGLTGAKTSQNRNLTALKAALNLAVTHRRVGPAAAQEWRDVKRHKAAGARRELYLDLKQRRALLDASEGAARDLLEAAALTGARAGELVRAKRSQFDRRTGSMTFIGKTGTRTVPLSPAAVKLFTRLAKRKLPGAPLLTRDDGKPWAHSDWDELVREAAKKARLPAGVVLYTLRHSFITQALLDGMVTLDVANLTGTSLAMIQKHYGHLVVDAARERLAKVTML